VGIAEKVYKVRGQRSRSDELIYIDEGIPVDGVARRGSAV